MGPFVYARIVETETLRRHCSRDGPGDCPHPIAVANASNIEKLSTGDVETFVPDSMMAARNGGVTLRFRRAIASEMEIDPADWPCNTVPRSAIVWPSASLEDHTHHECYHTFVSPKLANVVLHPGECKLLVKKTEIVVRSRKFR